MNIHQNIDICKVCRLLWKQRAQCWQHPQMNLGTRTNQLHILL